ncbi:nuclear transport factor 2 family protein [Streptomyces sp. NPDC001843]|uniref:nuclear transport factor 2 family protein n=1 Tax=Streptomyces sp. NPDC001843 TaxID=3364617 RepID=UPI0036C9E59E
MTAYPDQSTRDEVVAAFRAQLQAMVDGNTDALEALLASGYHLTHITGYEQPKAEWLAQMRAGQFAYHRVEEVDMTVEVAGRRLHALAVGSRSAGRDGLLADHLRRRMSSERISTPAAFSWQCGRSRYSPGGSSRNSPGPGLRGLGCAGQPQGNQEG